MPYKRSGFESGIWLYQRLVTLLQSKSYSPKKVMTAYGHDREEVNLLPDKIGNASGHAEPGPIGSDLITQIVF
jgi:hypothetical protein